MPYLKIPDLPKIEYEPTFSKYKILDNCLYIYAADADLSDVDMSTIDHIQICKAKNIPKMLKWNKKLVLHVHDDYDNDSNESYFNSTKLKKIERLIYDEYKIPKDRVQITTKLEIDPTCTYYNLSGTMSERSHKITIIPGKKCN